MDLNTEKRCDCGKLLFKRTSYGIEFKCHRCKRTHLIPTDRLSTEYHSLCPIVDTDEYIATMNDQKPSDQIEDGKS